MFGQIWTNKITHSCYMNDIMIKQEFTLKNYKYVIRATCAKHISESISQLKTLNTHISCLECENSSFILMEHHENECFLIKQTQDNDRLRLIRAFELNSLIECSKIEHVLKLIRSF
jgi:hypothetical protein